MLAVRQKKVGVKPVNHTISETGSTSVKPRLHWLNNW